VTRVVDVVDEHRLAELALTATASQLARMIAGFRSADGMRIGRQAKRNLSWHEREDGRIDVRARLPKDEAALLLAAIAAAKDQFGPPPGKPAPCGEKSKASPDASRYSLRMPWWMWLGCFSTPLRRIVPVRTAPWWWCRCRRRTWPETFPRERRKPVRQVWTRAETFPRERPHWSRRSVTLTVSGRLAGDRATACLRQPDAGRVDR
jgi:hypothetical protein